MRSYRSIFLSASLAVCCGLLAPVAKAQQPVAIVSIAPLDRLKKDISHLLEATSMGQVAPMVDFFGNFYTKGIDGTRPIGVQVTLEGEMPKAVIFIPVSNLQEFFTALEGIGIEPDEIESNLYEIITPGPAVFAKLEGDWLYVAQAEDDLATVPANPDQMLGTLPQRYDLAIRMNVQALPAELTDMMTNELRTGFENSLADQDQTAEEQELAKKSGEAQLAQIEKLLAELNQVFLGWSVNSSERVTLLDLGFQCVEGSSLAEQANLAANVTSDYQAFQLADSAASFQFAQEIPESERELAIENFRNSMQQAKGMIEKQAEIPTALANALLDTLSKVLEGTIQDGKLDGAGSLSVADDTLRILFGGRIADGAAFAADVKALAADLPPEIAGDVAFDFDYDTYKGVTLHRATVQAKIADPAAQEVFGNELKLVIGTADKGFLVALDPSGDAAVRQAIDAMQAAGTQKSTPFASVVRLEQILAFVQTLGPNPMIDIAVDSIREHSGNDTVQVNGRPIKDGAIYSFSIDDGILKAVGTAAQGGGGGGF